MVSGRFYSNLSALALAAVALIPSPVKAQAPLTQEELRAGLAGQTSNAAGAALAEKVRQWFGSDNLKGGANPKVRDLTVAWAIEVPGATPQKPPRIVTEENAFTLPLTRIGESDLWAGVATLPEGEAFRWSYEVGGERQERWRQLEVYTTSPDRKPQPGVPQGKVIEMPEWKSQIFEGTTRDWWIYVPAQYTADTPAAVMVFQDGGKMRGSASTIFDNLIARGEMPVTIGIFIDPGRRAGQRRGDRPANRSVEYDTLSDRYSRFLLEEILPEAAKQYNLRTDAAGRAIAGTSSGGICAFTVAWERPDAFHKVISGVGSFVNLQGGASGIGGGHNYPPLIRQSQRNPKPIRVFLTDGINDIDNQFGNWPLANQQMEKALAFSGYDYKFVWGKGFHSDSFFHATLPDALRWIWRDEAKK